MTVVEMLETNRQIDDIEQHLIKLGTRMTIKSKTNDTLEQLFEVNTILIKLVIQEMRYSRNLTNEMAKALGE